MAKPRLPFSIPRELLARYKAVTGIATNYGVAKKLSVTPQAVAKWEQGYGMDETAAVQIAQELDLNPLTTVAEVKFEAAKTPRERLVWEKYCARVFVAALATAALTATPRDPAAAAVSPTNYGNLSTYTLCALRRWLKKGLIPSMVSVSRTVLRQWLRPSVLAYT